MSGKISVKSIKINKYNNIKVNNYNQINRMINFPKQTLKMIIVIKITMIKVNIIKNLITNNKNNIKINCSFPIWMSQKLMWCKKVIQIRVYKIPLSRKKKNSNHLILIYLSIINIIKLYFKREKAKLKGKKIIDNSSNLN